MAKLKVRLSEPERHETGCLLCGAPLVYEREAVPRRCALCGEKFLSNCACAQGHYVCDRCHTAGLDRGFLPRLIQNLERDPLALLEDLFLRPEVHLHGPEHHSLVPCVLLTAYRNCGGEIDLPAALARALERGKQVPGGTCGYWGACGAAIGAGIYMSVLTDSDPLAEKVWDIPLRLTARCLEAIAALGGPRCCKRTSRIAVQEAARFTAEQLGVVMPLGRAVCGQHRKNKECIRKRCPFYPE